MKTDLPVCITVYYIIICVSVYKTRDAHHFAHIGGRVEWIYLASVNGENPSARSGRHL